jgi:hypothetical protein
MTTARSCDLGLWESVSAAAASPIFVLYLSPNKANAARAQANSGKSLFHFPSR